MNFTVDAVMCMKCMAASTVSEEKHNKELSDGLYFAVVSALVAALIFEHQNTRCCDRRLPSLSRVVTFDGRSSRKHEAQYIALVLLHAAAVKFNARAAPKLPALAVLGGSS